MILSLVWVALGVGLLYFGGELLVDHSMRLARFFGISAMVVGLTVVAFATSAPELAAAIAATLRGSPDIALGNAVGSNIANVGLILGLTAMLFVLPANRRFVRRELAFMVVVSLVLLPLLATGRLIGRLEGMALVGVLGLFLYYLIRDPQSQQEWEGEANDVAVGGTEIPPPPASPWRAVLGVVIGVGLLVGGANALVAGASQIALGFGISERVIGLTLVALGTSLPELAAALAAGRRGQADLVMGNVVGSNIFNILCILGLTAIVHPIDVAAEILTLDYWVMLAFSVLLLAFLLRRQRLTRVEGSLLFAGYVIYSVYLFLPGGA